MEKNPTYDKIEAFLDQRMPEIERKAFEQAIAQDPELATQVELQRFERDAMEVLVEEDLRSDMKVWKKEMLQSYAANNPDNIRKLRRRRRRYLAVAASFLVIVTAAALLWLNPFTNEQSAIASNETNNLRELPDQQPDLPDPNAIDEQPIAQLSDPQKKGTEATEDEQTPSPEQSEERPVTPLIQDNLQPQIQTAPQVATQNNTLELAKENFNDAYLLQQDTEGVEGLEEMKNAYTSGDFQKTAQLASGFKTPYPLGQEYLGAALIQQGDFQKAQQVYNNLMRLSLSDRSLRERTEWNLLLTYLALDQTNYVDFDRLLNRIKENKEHQFFDEADALFNQINK